jgi:glycosyltransferase involved in cell wall biosynthesis
VRSTEDFFNAIEGPLKDELFCRKEGLAGWKYVIENYTWEKSAFAINECVEFAAAERIKQ